MQPMSTSNEFMLYFYEPLFGRTHWLDDMENMRTSETATSKKQSAGFIAAARRPDPERYRLRVVTYNIHSCINRLGQASPDTVLAAIKPLRPDVIALQEVDVGIPRSGYQDQPRLLAEALEMEHAFYPTVHHPEGHYGLALLSKFDDFLISSGDLPLLPLGRFEKRGVMHMTLELPVGRIHIFNTHLSLFGLERRRQMKFLMGNQWLGSIDALDPVVFCGDLNAGPRSTVYRRLARLLTDVQSLCPPPKSTYSSRRPVWRIDHMFVSEHFKAATVSVPRNETVRRASDHLPLSAELLFANRQTGRR
jgi:endonuclease/exonuclease/phosphatase family metal-dependent hydrolase